MIEIDKMIDQMELEEALKSLATGLGVSPRGVRFLLSKLAGDAGR